MCGFFVSKNSREARPEMSRERGDLRRQRPLDRHDSKQSGSHVIVIILWIRLNPLIPYQANSVALHILPYSYKVSGVLRVKRSVMLRSGLWFDIWRKHPLISIINVFSLQFEPFELNLFWCLVRVLLCWVSYLLKLKLMKEF